MALKSEKWFYRQCVFEVDRNGPLKGLSWDILKKGIAGEHKTRGHVTQPIGVTQVFLAEYPQHRKTIRDSSAARPFDILQHPTMLKDWVQWLKSKSGPLRKRFGYKYDTVKTYLSKSLGGHPKKGGGGDDEFKRVLRLMADFLDRK